MIVTTADEYESTMLATGRSARFSFHLNGSAPDLACIFTLYNQHGQAVINFNSKIAGKLDQTNDQIGHTLICEIDELGLLPGRYRMNVGITSNGEMQDHVEAAAIVEVEQGELRGRPVYENAGYGNVCMHHRWVLPA
jgi:lipopolysaccharide transport system ATP-binding protein